MNKENDRQTDRRTVAMTTYITKDEQKHDQIFLVSFLKEKFFYCRSTKCMSQYSFFISACNIFVVVATNVIQTIIIFLVIITVVIIKIAMVMITSFTVIISIIFIMIIFVLFFHNLYKYLS